MLGPQTVRSDSSVSSSWAAGDCCERGRARSWLTRKLACCPLTPRPCLRDLGKMGEFCKCPRHHLPSQPGSPVSYTRVRRRAQAGSCRGGDASAGSSCRCCSLLLKGWEPLPRAELGSPKSRQEPSTWGTRAFVQIHARAGAGRPILMAAPAPPPGRPHGKPTWPGGPGPALLGLVSTELPERRDAAKAASQPP